MHKHLLGVALILSVLAAAAWTGDENPLKKANVGDWVSYKGTNEAGGMKMDMEMKQTVIKKTDTEITLEIVQKVMGQEVKTTQTINLTEKYDPRTVSLKDKGDVTMKELEKGEETLTVAGKSLKTTWVSYEMSTTMGGQPMTIKGKAWTCPDVPLSGMVKTVSDMGAAKMTLELSGFGTK